MSCLPVRGIRCVATLGFRDPALPELDVCNAMARTPQRNMQGLGTGAHRKSVLMEPSVSAVLPTETPELHCSDSIGPRFIAGMMRFKGRLAV